MPSLVWFFLGLSGRISRAAYFLAGLLLNLIPAFMLYRMMLVPEQTTESEMWAMAFVIAGFASLWSAFALSVKRLHDFGKPGGFAILVFVPAISIIAFVVFCIIPGDAGPNQYGERTNAPR
jgi:uncharacterized membrane protein YhaH (DUF805 family)